jgi:hypothetical protein
MIIVIFCCYRLSIIACLAPKSVQHGGSYLCFICLYVNSSGNFGEACFYRSVMTLLRVFCK